MLHLDPLLADGATPIMMAGFLHLAFGNLLIAIVEGSLIVWIFRVRWVRAFVLMMLANSVSAWSAIFWLRYITRGMPNAVGVEWHFYHTTTAVVIIIAITWLVSAILEWPFCLLILHPRRRLLVPSLLATLLAQTASYLLLVPFYTSASWLDLGGLQADPAVVADAPDIATIYYLSPDGRELRQIRLNGRGIQAVKQLPEGQRDDMLYLDKRDDGRWDLCLYSRYDLAQVLVENVAGRGGLAWGPGDPPSYGPYMIHIGEAASVGGRDSNYSVRALYKLGLRIEDLASDWDTNVRFELPGVRWEPSNPSLLPGDLVVCELGDHVVLIDLPGRRIGMIAHGIQPVVVLDESALPPPTTGPDASEANP